MTYSEKLKDPRWQKKRLEILNRDNFSCKFCCDKESTLHVHHYEYIQGRDPWDYDNSNFWTLCAHCHEVHHLDFSEFERFLYENARNELSKNNKSDLKLFNKLVRTYHSTK